MDNQLDNFLSKAGKKLKKAGVNRPRNEAELIIADILGKRTEDIIAYPKIKLTPTQLTKFNSAINRRINQEPIAYILNKKEFFNLSFFINESTLIPRPETELLVEKTLKLIKNNKKYFIIELGTGSGCITISIAKNLPRKTINTNGLQLLASDISNNSLNVAKKNATLHNVSRVINFKKGSLLEPFEENIKKLPSNQHLVIIANLPYLSEKIYNDTSPSVKKYEPKIALISGKEGLDHYRELFNQILSLHNQVLKYKKSTIHLIIEISPEQKAILEKEVPRTFADFSSMKLKFHKDLARKWRLLKIKLTP